jgi:hypothetical protein
VTKYMTHNRRRLGRMEVIDFVEQSQIDGLAR